MAKLDKKIIGITPAMREGSGMVEFSENFSDRYFDVGIAEQHSVTLAAGLAADGMKPVVAIYSSFLQRAYDQLIHDVALQNLPVLFALDRSGIVGGDGSTHNGSFDLSYLRCIPNMIVMTPSDENECRQMLFSGIQYAKPVAVRYPRGKGPGTVIQKTFSEIPLGKAEIRRTGKRIALLAFGSMVAAACDVAEIIDATVVNMRFVKPLDTTLLKTIAHDHDCIITMEENVVMGGAGSAVNEYFISENMIRTVANYGLPDEFIEHGDPATLLKENKLDAAGLLERIHATWLHCYGEPLEIITTNPKSLLLL